MATRFFLTNSPPGFTPSTFQGTYNDTTLASNNVFVLSDVKMGTNAAAAVTETSTTNNYKALHGRWVSPPIAGGTLTAANANYTITHTMARDENSASANMTVYITVYVTVGDSDAVRGTLIVPFVGATEFATTSTILSYSLQFDNTVVAQAGDRIVVELGYNAANTSATSFTGTVRYGGTAADLATSGTTGVTTNSPWVEFSTSCDAVVAPQGAVRFDADGEDYSWSGGTAINPPCTIMCWGMVSSDRNAFSTFIELNSGSNTNQIMLDTDSDGTTLNGFSMPSSRVAIGTGMTVGAWYKMAIVVSGGTGTLYHAPAGSALSSAAFSGAITSTGLTGGRIGEAVSGGEWLNGRVANAKFYSAALTVAELENEFAQYEPVRVADLVRAYVHPLYALGADYSSNGNTLSGGSGAAAQSGPPIPIGARGGFRGTTPLVRSTASATGTSVSSIAPSKPTGLAVGDYLLAVVVVDADGSLTTMTAPAGFALIGSQAGHITNNYPSVKVWGKIADSADVAASTFTFGVDSGAGSAMNLIAVVADTYSRAAPTTAVSWTVTPRTSDQTITAPTTANVLGGLLIACLCADTNNVAQSFSTPPTGMAEIGDAGQAFALCGVFSESLFSGTGNTGTRSATPTPSSTTNGWTSASFVLNPGPSAYGSARMYAIPRASLF